MIADPASLPPDASVRRGYLSAGSCLSQRPARSIAATPEFEQRQAGTGPVGQAIGRVPGINIKRTTMAHEESKLFSPLKIGEKTVKNRMVVAPMSRHRAALSGVPTDLNRSEERRVGKECVSTCRSRWSPYL